VISKKKKERELEKATSEPKVEDREADIGKLSSSSFSLGLFKNFLCYY